MNRELSMIGPDEIRHRFGHHPITADMKQRHEQLQEAYIAFGEFLDAVLPDGRAKSTAFANLQQSSMWAAYAIDATTPAKRVNTKEDRQNGRREQPARAELPSAG